MTLNPSKNEHRMDTGLDLGGQGVWDPFPLSVQLGSLQTDPSLLTPVPPRGMSLDAGTKLPGLEF